MGVKAVGEEEEGANFASRLEVLHVLMVPEEIPKGVEVEDIGMDENTVGVVVGSGNQMQNLAALCKKRCSLHVTCLLVVLCNGLFGELLFADWGC